MNFSFVSFQRFRRLYLRRHQSHNTLNLNSLNYIKRIHALFLSARAHVLADGREGKGVPPFAISRKVYSPSMKNYLLLLIHNSNHLYILIFFGKNQWRSFCLIYIVRIRTIMHQKFYHFIILLENSTP